MKKLMIAVAAVAMGFAASASTVNWGGNTTQYSGVSKFNAYLINAANYATADAAVAALMNGTMAAADIWYTKENISAASGKVGISVSGKTMTGSAAPDGALNDKAFSVWSIILDGTIGTDGTAKHYFSMTGSTPFSDTASSAGLAKVTLGDVSAKSTWQSVPEPTSGLLLLLGVAGLALRRRRA